MLYMPLTSLSSPLYYFLFFFFNDTATTEIYTLSLHDALPISRFSPAARAGPRRRVGARSGPPALKALDRAPTAGRALRLLRHRYARVRHPDSAGAVHGRPLRRPAAAHHADPRQLFAVPAARRAALEASERSL